MDSADWEYERNRLERVLGEIRVQLSLREDQAHLSWGEFQDVLNSYWDDRFADDEAQHVATVERQRQLHAISYQKVKKLALMAGNPYFGRIDFLENRSAGSSQPPEQIYLGIGSLLDSYDGEILIYDWRAPVGGLFYDYEQGPAEYQCPAGAVRGEIILKRQYKIENGRLELMFDCQLKIDDQILQELLSKKVDEKMRSIVTSIQREQNRVIRDERHRLLVVQGAAGSGKTSIALHRAAYLLYKERKAITAKNILIFSPNRVFSDYISDVLPELGEENVRQTNFQDFLQKNIFQLPQEVKPEEWAGQLEYLITAPEDETYRLTVSSIRLKSGPVFAEFIKKYACELEDSLGRNYPDLIFENHLIFSKKDWEILHQELAYLPLGQRLRQIKRGIFMKMRPVIKELRRQKLEEISSGGEEVNEKTMKAMARLNVWKELGPLRGEIERLTNLDILAYYRRLYDKQREFWRATQSGLEFSEDWPTVCAHTLSRFDHGSIPYEDLIPLLYLRGCFEGFPSDSSIRHLVIDEAQDYTLLQYEIIKRLFPRAAWTVLGDLDQTVHPGLNITDFRIIAEVFGDSEALLIKLSKSYRSTSEILGFCRALLPGDEPLDHLDRPGVKPEIGKVGRPEALSQIITRKIAALGEEGFQSIAVICKSYQESVLLYKDLQTKTPVNLVTKEETNFRRGVTLIPIYLAKGLEFDAVIIPDAGSGKYRRDWERRLLYIACTRALHRLVLLYHGELSPLIPWPSDLYSHGSV